MNVGYLEPIAATDVFVREWAAPCPGAASAEAEALTARGGEAHETHPFGHQGWRWLGRRVYEAVFTIPAAEEIISPFAKAHFVGGDVRGSHVMPLMPVPPNTPVTGMYCLPIVSCAGFSIEKDGRFLQSVTDFFDNPAWDEVRRRAQRKAIEKRGKGWSGAAMMPYSELEYGGFRDTMSALLKRFRLREERKPEAAE
jgi:Fructose-1,6-bisphosphatase